jgi:hypothetical protein
VHQTVPTGDRLESHKNTWRHLKTKEDLKNEADKAFAEVCKFVPTLATRLSPPKERSSSRSSSRSTSRDRPKSAYEYTGNSDRSASGIKRIEEMQLKYRLSIQSREKQRQLNESFDVLTDCTFTPALCTGSERNKS